MAWSRPEPGPDVLQRLHDAQALLRMAAKVGRLGAWSLDPGTGVLTLSDEVCALHEVAPGFSCTPQQALDFYEPRSREKLLRAIEACLDQGVAFDHELQFVTAGGRRLWVRVIGYAERDAHGAVYKVQGAFQDITATRGALEHGRVLAERLAMTLESMTDGFYTLDREWRFTYVNAQTGQLVARSRGELLGRVIWDVFPEAIGSDIHREYERALVDDVAVELETYYAPMGRWVQLRAFPSAQGLAVSFRDVTAKVRNREAMLRLNSELEERVRERTAELEAVNRELEAFSFSVAHDLRSPLAAINCFAQMLQETEGNNLSARGAAFLGRIRRAATQMDGMTDGLLELARLGRAPLCQQEVDLGAIALQAFEVLRAQQPDRRIDTVVAAGLRACGDPVLLTQLVSNLVGNAWKFTGRCAGARIEIGAAGTAGGQACFFVRDNGAGFDMAHAASLFEPFRRLHSVAEYEGNGIGLATVHKIVARHGGRIWAEAAPGQGATFRFTLPAPAG